MKICELKQKEVINICTCRSLGCPIDAEFDCKSSQLTALILPGPGRFCCLFGRDNEYIIPWECISQIGDDIILVRLEEKKEKPPKPPKPGPPPGPPCRPCPCPPPCEPECGCGDPKKWENGRCGREKFW